MKRTALGLLSSLSLLSAAAHADPIHWNTWISSNSGEIALPGTAITVTFSTTNPHNADFNSTSWGPAATFADGTIVDNGPTAANGIMSLTGGTAALNTLTFSQPVADPVIAIWSLGQGGTTANFTFQDATPTFVAGGTSTEYNGAPIVVTGNIVSGNEGNGTVSFNGHYTQISWTNTVQENWYGFNVGIVQAVPEPSQVAMLSLGLGVVLFGIARQKPRQNG